MEFLFLYYWCSHLRLFRDMTIPENGLLCISEPRYCGRVFSASACQAGGLWFKSGILPLLKHACGESDQLLCWLYIPAEVLHQMWISGNVYHVCLHKVRIRQNPLWLCHQKSETGVSVAPKMDLCPTKIFFKKNQKTMHQCVMAFTWWVKHHYTPQEVQ